jgi:hypothetical protein
MEDIFIINFMSKYVQMDLPRYSPYMEHMGIQCDAHIKSVSPARRGLGSALWIGHHNCSLCHGFATSLRVDGGRDHERDLVALGGQCFRGMGMILGIQHIYIYLIYWLVVCNRKFIFSYIGNNHPN